MKRMIAFFCVLILTIAYTGCSVQPPAEEVSSAPSEGSSQVAVDRPDSASSAAAAASSGAPSEGSSQAAVDRPDSAASAAVAASSGAAGTDPSRAEDASSQPLPTSAGESQEGSSTDEVQYVKGHFAVDTPVTAWRTGPGQILQDEQQQEVLLRFKREVEAYWASIQVQDVAEWKIVEINPGGYKHYETSDPDEIRAGVEWLHGLRLQTDYVQGGPVEGSWGESVSYKDHHGEQHLLVTAADSYALFGNGGLLILHYNGEAYFDTMMRDVALIPG